MKKTFLILMAMCINVCAFAEKTVVVVDYFTSSSAKTSQMNNLRNHVVAGIAETSRVSLIDAESESALKLEANRRSSELALADQSVRLGEMKRLGADYLVTGHIVQASAEKGGVDYYVGNVIFSLKVVKTEDGTLVGTETYQYSGATAGTGKTSDAAVNETLEKAQKAMGAFVSKYFKSSGTIVELGEMKNGKIQNCYVSVGTSTGVEEGQVFIIKETKTLLGYEAIEEIGKIKIEKVHGPEISFCKIVNGSDAILAAFQAGHELSIVSKEKKETGRNLAETGRDVMNVTREVTETGRRVVEVGRDISNIVKMISKD